MKDYLKPLIRRKPDDIILHIGTNNLKNSSATPQQLAEGISNLGTQIRNSSPSTKICLSALLIRNDNSNLVTKIQDINKRVRAICISKNWSYIDNSNVRINLALIAEAYILIAGEVIYLFEIFGIIL